MKALIAVVVVVFLMLLIVAESGRSSQHVVTGTVVGSRAGEWISVVNDATDPAGLRIVVHDATAYERGDHEFVDPVLIRPGACVTVWYRSVGERRPVADKVRVLLEQPKPLDEPEAALSPQGNSRF